MHLFSAKQIDFTRGSIIVSILRFSLPIMLGDLLQTLYNSVDALVVGNFVGETALAAVSVCAITAMTFISFFNGMSIGGTIVVSRAAGAGNYEKLRNTVVVAFSFSFLLGVAFSLIGIAMVPFLLKVTGARADYYAEAAAYLRIYLGGLMFTVLYNNGAGVLRAAGDVQRPFIILVVTCVLNILLDLLFVAVFGLGVKGAAYATLVSQLISAVAVYSVLCRQYKGNCLNFRAMIGGKTTICDMMRYGSAAGLQAALVGISNLFVVRYMNLFDTSSVAGMGIAQKLDKFVGLLARTIGITVTAFVGQNIGAGTFERIAVGKNKSLALSLGVTAGLCVIAFGFARPLVALFNTEPQVVDVGSRMLRVLVPGLLMLSFREVYTGVLRGYGKALWPTILNLCGMVGVRQLFVSVGMRMNGAIENVFWCFPVSWAATAIFLMVYYAVVRRSFPGQNHSRQ